MNLNGCKLIEVNNDWLDSDLTVTSEDVGAEMEKEKVWDQFEAYHKRMGRRATYDESLCTTSLDTSKVGCKIVEAIVAFHRPSVGDSASQSVSQSVTL